MVQVRKSEFSGLLVINPDSRKHLEEGVEKSLGLFEGVLNPQLFTDLTNETEWGQSVGSAKSRNLGDTPKRVRDLIVTNPSFSFPPKNLRSVYDVHIETRLEQ